MKIVTIIVAIINNDFGQVRKCLSSIDISQFEVIIVCPNNYHTSISKILNEFVDFKVKTAQGKSTLRRIDKAKTQAFKTARAKGMRALQKKK